MKLTLIDSSVHGDSRTTSIQQVWCLASRPPDLSSHWQWNWLPGIQSWSTSQGIIKKTNVSQQHVSLLGDRQRWSISVTVMFTPSDFRWYVVSPFQTGKNKLLFKQSLYPIKPKSKALQIKTWSSILPSTLLPHMKLHLVHGSIWSMAPLLQLSSLRLDKLQSIEPWCQEQKTSVFQLSWKLKQFS